MALKILCRVKKLSAHQGRDKEGVDSQCYHLRLERSTDEKLEKRDLSVYKRNWDPVVVEKASASRPELVNLGEDRLESKLVADPTFLLCSSHHRSGPHKGHPVLWVLRRKHLVGWWNGLKLTRMHFSSRPSMIFLSFSVMMPASSMWPSVGNRFFTCMRRLL